MDRRRVVVGIIDAVTDRGPSGADTTLACPFVAYDDDRDARSDHPDHRHRCYAEVRPAPRATAHQEQYCLTAAFGTCPTFQDWARREAARVRWPSTRPSGLAGSVAAAASGGPTPVRPSTPPEDAPVDAAVPPSKPQSGSRSRKGAADPDTGSAAAGAAAGLAASRFLPPDGSVEGPPTSNDRRTWAAPPPWSPGQADDADEAQAPDFLRDPGATSAAPPPSEERELLPAVPEWPEPDDVPPPTSRRRREHVDLGAPSWEEPRRFEAYPTVRSRVGMPSLSRPLAGLIVLVLAAAALFLLPSFFFGGGGGAGASPSPSPSASIRPSPSPSPEPSPTPVVYVVKKGDTMTKIANAHGVTLEALMEANKDTVSDPNKVKVGQELIIPVAPVDGSEEPAPSGEAPSP
jgi:nucleoid-associated protein YgaU